MGVRCGDKFEGVSAPLDHIDTTKYECLGRRPFPACVTYETAKPLHKPICSNIEATGRRTSPDGRVSFTTRRGRVSSPTHHRDQAQEEHPHLDRKLLEQIREATGWSWPRRRGPTPLPTTLGVPGSAFLGPRAWRSRLSATYVPIMVARRGHSNRPPRGSSRPPPSWP